MMNPENIASRFPNLKEGEVAFVSSNGVLFNKGTEAEREAFANRYCWRMKFANPQKVIGVALETVEEELDKVAEESVESSKPLKGKNSNKK